MTEWQKCSHDTFPSDSQPPKNTGCASEEVIPGKPLAKESADAWKSSNNPPSLPLYAEAHAHAHAHAYIQNPLFLKQ